eukprot:scaffold23472_cov146-Isochrysis_galbana.AAC.2
MDGARIRMERRTGRRIEATYARTGGTHGYLLHGHLPQECTPCSQRPGGAHGRLDVPLGATHTCHLDAGVVAHAPSLRPALCARPLRGRRGTAPPCLCVGGCAAPRWRRGRRRARLSRAPPAPSGGGGACTASSRRYGGTGWSGPPPAPEAGGDMVVRGVTGT